MHNHPEGQKWSADVNVPQLDLGVQHVLHPGLFPKVSLIDTACYCESAQPYLARGVGEKALSLPKQGQARSVFLDKIQSPSVLSATTVE